MKTGFSRGRLLPVRVPWARRSLRTAVTAPRGALDCVLDLTPLHPVSFSASLGVSWKHGITMLSGYEKE